VVHGWSRYRCADMIDIRLVETHRRGESRPRRRGVDPPTSDRLAAMDWRRAPRWGPVTRCGRRSRRSPIRWRGRKRATQLGPSSGRRERAPRRGAATEHGGGGRPGGRPPGAALPAQPAGAGRARRRGEDHNVVARCGRRGAGYTDAQRVPHWEIGTELGLLDMERGASCPARCSLYRGFRGPACCGPSAPSARQPLRRVRGGPAPDVGADRHDGLDGHLPKFERRLPPGTRRPVAIPRPRSAHLDVAGDVLEEADLPLKLTAGTACYRREAVRPGGTARPAARPRVRQVRALRLLDPGQAPALLDSMVARARGAAAPARPAVPGARPVHGRHRQLGGPDLRLESNSPGVDMWLEVSSVSWCTDYQAGGPTSATDPRVVARPPSSTPSTARRWRGPASGRHWWRPAAGRRLGRPARGARPLPAGRDGHLGRRLKVPGEPQAARTGSVAGRVGSGTRHPGWW